MELEEIINSASEHELEENTVTNFADSQNLSLVEFVNTFAITLAEGYQNKKYSYDFSDDAANWLFCFMTNDLFLSSNNNTVPSPAYDIYLAFDEGEYFHKDDPKDVDPEEKYTKPRITEILSGKYS